MLGLAICKDILCNSYNALVGFAWARNSGNDRKIARGKAVVNHILLKKIIFPHCERLFLCFGFAFFRKDFLKFDSFFPT